MKIKTKTKIRIIEILFIISLIISILSIRSTYAKYQELVGTAYQVNIRKWYIVVNEKDIQDENVLMSDILVPTYVENEYMRDGVLVPGREGYFDFDLDYTKIDVPFEYSFEIHQSNEETKQLSDLEFTGYSIEYPILQENFKFQINSAENEILYIQTEEDENTGEVIETVLTEAELDDETGNKILEIIEELENPETGESLGQNKVVTATISIDEETNLEVITIKQKIVDSSTGEEIEPEQELFNFSYEIDETTNQTTYKVINSIDPTELDNFKRYQNLKVYFKWNDDENNQMNNLADTTFVGEDNPNAEQQNSLIKYQATMKFKQYIPEVATP